MMAQWMSAGKDEMRDRRCRWTMEAEGSLYQSFAMPSSLVQHLLYTHGSLKTTSAHVDVYDMACMGFRVLRGIMEFWQGTLTGRIFDRFFSTLWPRYDFLISVE